MAEEIRALVERRTEELEKGKVRNTKAYRIFVPCRLKSRGITSVEDVFGTV
jgi:hypothetical protein